MKEMPLGMKRYWNNSGSAKAENFMYGSHLVGSDKSIVYWKKNYCGDWPYSRCFDGIEHYKVDISNKK